MSLQTLLWRMDGVRGGAPGIRNSRLGVEHIAQRFCAGESIAEIATDYQKTEDEVTAALRLVLLVRGTNVHERRAAAKAAKLLPLETR